VAEYNFRYQSERERFYQDVVADWESIYESEGAVVASGLRIVFEITDAHDESERKDSVAREQRGEPEFKGIKVFRDLDRLRAFLDSSSQHGSGIQWGKRTDLMGSTHRCRISRYLKKGKRVLKEETLKKYFIVTEKN